jgi:hypothetical protein
MTALSHIQINSVFLTELIFLYLWKANLNHDYTSRLRQFL